MKTIFAIASAAERFGRELKPRRTESLDACRPLACLMGVLAFRFGCKVGSSVCTRSAETERKGRFAYCPTAKDGDGHPTACVGEDLQRVVQLRRETGQAPLQMQLDEPDDPTPIPMGRFLLLNRNVA